MKVCGACIDIWFVFGLRLCGGVYGLRCLSSFERGLVDSVIKVFDRPRSLTLIRVLVKIIVKVRRAMMSPIERLMEHIGKTPSQNNQRYSFLGGVIRAL